MKMKSGGGIKSRVVSHSRHGKQEPIAKAANVAGVAQQGLSTAFRKEPLIQGPAYTPAKVGAIGIANARQGHSGPGPGGGNRTIYGSGSQSPTPQAREMPKGRDTLSEYGKDIPGRR
jgi:hypothetical protein